MAYTVGVAACLAAFYFTPAAWPAVQWVTVFFIGFFLYGPQMLIGLCGAELVRWRRLPYTLSSIHARARLHAAAPPAVAVDVHDPARVQPSPGLICCLRALDELLGLH